VAGSLHLPPDAPPAAQAVTHLDVGAPFQPGAAIAVCVRPAVLPPMPRPDARNLPSRTAPALIADSASGRRVGGSLAAATPCVNPLDHNGSCNGTRTGDEICDPVGGAFKHSFFLKLRVFIRKKGRKSVYHRLTSARGARNIKIERHLVRSC